MNMQEHRYDELVCHCCRCICPKGSETWLKRVCLAYLLRSAHWLLWCLAKALFGGSHLTVLLDLTSCVVPYTCRRGFGLLSVSGKCTSGRYRWLWSCGALNALVDTFGFCCMLYRWKHLWRGGLVYRTPWRGYTVPVRGVGYIELIRMCDVVVIYGREFRYIESNPYT